MLNNKTAISIEVEPETELFKRFDAAMSIGIKREAEALAQAMNTLGGFSQIQVKEAKILLRYGTNKVSRIKQIASSRLA